MCFLAYLGQRGGWGYAQRKGTGMKRLKVMLVLAVMTMAITLSGAAVALAGPGGGSPWYSWGEVCELNNDAPGASTGLKYKNNKSGQTHCFKP